MGENVNNLLSFMGEGEDGWLQGQRRVLWSMNELSSAKAHMSKALLPADRL